MTRSTCRPARFGSLTRSRHPNLPPESLIWTPARVKAWGSPEPDLIPNPLSGNGSLPDRTSPALSLTCSRYKKQQTHWGLAPRLSTPRPSMVVYLSTRPVSVTSSPLLRSTACAGAGLLGVGGPLKLFVGFPLCRRATDEYSGSLHSTTHFPTLYATAEYAKNTSTLWNR